MTAWKEDILNWLDFYSSCEMLEAQGLEKKLIKIVEEVEARARAEERARIVGEIEARLMGQNVIFNLVGRGKLEEAQKCNQSNHTLHTLLASLDKPLKKD